MDHVIVGQPSKPVRLILLLRAIVERQLYVLRPVNITMNDLCHVSQVGSVA